jgi:hypothetical protein
MKLAVAGSQEEEIAALDGDWSEFTPAQRAAFAFARKITYEPHRFDDGDVEQLRKHFKDLQILEMLLSVAGNNSINRSKEGVGVPQSKELSHFLRNSDKPADPDRVLPSKTFLTPTPERFKDKITKVAPFPDDGKSDKLTRPTVCARPPLETRAKVEKSWRPAPRGRRAYRWSKRTRHGRSCSKIGPTVRCRSGCGSWPTSRGTARSASPPSAPPRSKATSSRYSRPR